MQINRTPRPRVTRRTINAATAAEAVGPIEPHCEIYGLSKGQFSLIELIEYILSVTGPARLTVSTWTAAGADLAHCQALLDDGRVQSCRWLVDYSFPSRQPAYCRQLRERFGDDAIACTANHAKFVLVRNERWSIVVRTSMNLNLNRRLESYEISDDATLADWLEHIVDETFAAGATIQAAADSGHGAAFRAKETINSIGGAVGIRPSHITHAATQTGVSYD